MSSISTLGQISVSQYSLFLGIALILFGWIEKKEKLILIGQAIFVLLGLLVAWFLFSGDFSSTEPLGNVITKANKIHGFFKLTTYFAGINLISIFLLLFKIRFHKTTLIVITLAALALFFMAMNILQMPG